MNCQRIQEECLLEALHDGALPSEAAAAVRAHIGGCAACRAHLAALERITAQLALLPAAAEAAAPSERLRANFHAMLAAESCNREGASRTEPAQLARRSRIDSFFARLFPRRPVYQFGAALALLAVGLFVGSRYLAPAPAAAIASHPDAVSAAANAETAAELAALRAQMNNMGRLVTYSLLQQKSTSERLQSVLATLQLESPDKQLLTDLVGTLALDPSVNVRLSAVEALAPHTDSDIVRAGLLAALPRETAPLVQVALIELIASTRDGEAASAFAQLARDDKADPTVRETARRALVLLSGRTQLLEDAPSDDDTLSHTQTTNKTAA